MRCSRCGTELPAGARFCSSCGAPVAGLPAAEERKFVSVLFVDVVGSTAHADGADPEDVRDRNQLYYREVRDRIERHGGTIEKYVGDAVMAVFGAPLARSDDAERAVRAAISILEGIAALNERDPSLDLQVRAAVCTGEAIVSVDVAPADALATGDVVNTAARLQSAAPTGRVVVGAETYRLTRHAFDYQELEAVDAKGKRDPVQAWLVERSLVAPAERPTSTTPLVGRDREVLLIRTVWDRAVTAGSPHVVTVVGPAGIGKSRLARGGRCRRSRREASAACGDGACRTRSRRRTARSARSCVGRRASTRTTASRWPDRSSGRSSARSSPKARPPIRRATSR